MVLAVTVYATGRTSGAQRYSVGTAVSRDQLIRSSASQESQLIHHSAGHDPVQVVPGGMATGMPTETAMALDVILIRTTPPLRAFALARTGAQVSPNH